MTDAADLRYELTMHSLANGLRLCVQPDPNAPGVAVNLWYEVGSFDEAPGRSGFAHLFEHLMFQGSADVASGEHMASIEAVGGSVNATTSTDRTNYFETVPAGALELALWLEANRMASLEITQANFEAQREVVKEEKRQRYDNQPYGDLLELVVAQHYDASHPYGHLTIGSMADLDAAELEHVQQFFDAWYRPANARLVIAGDVSPGQAIDLVERHFGQLRSAPAPSHAEAAPAGPEPRHTRVVRDVPHSLVYTTWATPPAAHPDNVPLELALSILADGHASRLHRALVRDLGVAEEAHAAALPFLRSSSITTILARPVRGGATEPVAEALLAEVRRFAEDGPTAEELARAVAQYERNWLLSLATLEERADVLNDSWLTHDDPGRVNTRLAEVTALTAAAVRDAARSYLAAPASELHYLSEEGN